MTCQSDLIDLAWISNIAYICFAYVEECHSLQKLCRFQSCFLWFHDNCTQLQLLPRLYYVAGWHVWGLIGSGCMIWQEHMIWQVAICGCNCSWVQLSIHLLPQNFIWKNNLQRQHLLMIPLSRQIREKLAHETLDDSPMRKNSDNYYKWLLESYISELNSTLLWVRWMWFPIVTEE